MRRHCFICVFLTFLGLSLSAHAITVAGLQKEIAAGQKTVLIDLRETRYFVQGHIPGAINIPASLCPLKKLPPFGKVIIYDDGLERRGATALKKAAAALAGKPGISVDILAGGFAAWQSAQGLTTGRSGLQLEHFEYITYAELTAADPSTVLLVDLRKPTKIVLKDSGALTDLSHEFPGRRVATSAPDEKDGGSPLVVLIDSADGSAEAEARMLKVRGIQKYAILVGGELAIAHKGRPGLERSGPRLDASAQKPTPGK